MPPPGKTDPECERDLRLLQKDVVSDYGGILTELENVPRSDREAFGEAADEIEKIVDDLGAADLHDDLRLARRDLMRGLGRVVGGYRQALNATTRETFDAGFERGAEGEPAGQRGRRQAR